MITCYGAFDEIFQVELMLDCFDNYVVLKRLSISAAWLLIVFAVISTA